MPQFLPVNAGPQSFVLADKLAYCRFNYLWQPPKVDPANPAVWSPTPLNDRLAVGGARGDGAARGGSSELCSRSR